MLSMINLADVAAFARDRSGMGALLTCGGEADLRIHAAEPLRPQPTNAAFHFGSGITEACLANSDRQPTTCKKYAHPTRVAIAFGGALGPHPARDPV
jgi:hypothetical protein